MATVPGRLLAHAREIRDDGSLVEIAIWQLDAPILLYTHCYKYRPYFGKRGVCRVRCGNERGKGDHRHAGEAETRHVFTSLERLLADFRRDVESWRNEP